MKNFIFCTVRQASAAHRMWEILSNQTTRNWLTQATIMHNHGNVEKKEYFPSEGKCETENIIYKFIVSTTGVPDKPYLRTAKEVLKKYFITVSLLS